MTAGVAEVGCKINRKKKHSLITTTMSFDFQIDFTAVRNLHTHTHTGHIIFRSSNE